MRISTSRMPLAMAMICLFTQTAFGQAAKMEKWTPSDALVKKLGVEKAMQTWAIRPPQDYQFQTVKEESETRTLWGKAGSALIVVESHKQPIITLEKGMEAVVARLKTRTKTLTNTKFESGTINGKNFMRTRISATGLPGIPGEGFGFVYASFETKKPTVIMGFGTAENIEAMEAAALTFRVVE